MSWTIEQVSPNSARMRVEYERNSDWEFYILISADRHIDHPLSDLQLQQKHLKQALAGGWPVIDMGDLYCAMQGKRDPRKSRKALLDKLNEREEYFDALVDYAYETLSPYSSVLSLLGMGNHELGSLKNNETHLLNRLVQEFNNDGAPTLLGGYQGWVKLMFENSAKNARESKNIRYTHGKGADAPQTKGVLEAPRRAVIYPDADIVISGHTHYQWAMPISRFRLNDYGREYRDEQLHLQTPSYKDEVTGQTEGFAVEKQHLPKPMGAWWAHFWYEKGKGIRFRELRAL